MTDHPESVADALPKEMARIRDEVLPEYDALPTGVFAATMMRAELDRAAKAMVEGDTIQMIKSLQELRGFTL